MIIRARTVVTMNGAPIDNGAVAAAGNRIVDVGTFDDIRTRNSGKIADLGEQALLPGLINAHCHLDYTCLRGKISRQKSFSDWIRAINAEKSALSPEDFVGSINDGFKEAKRFGTTTIANLTAFPELAPQIRPPIRTCWFAELIDIRAPIDLESADTSVLLKRFRGGGIAALQNFGLAPHTLFTASKDLFRRCEEIAQQQNLLLSTHLAESREEVQMFRDAAGHLYEFIKSIGRPVDDCGNATPLGLFLESLSKERASCGRGASQWILAHLNELSESDFDLLRQSDSRFHLVHCPRSHHYFGHSPFAFDRLRSLGLNICLGTDSLASNESLSLFAEMREFQHKFPSVSAEEILQMVTVNSARALRKENALGQIRVGFRADLIAVPCSVSTDMFDEILAFNAPVSWSMIDGKL